ncbi:MAG TPA: MDR family MFS transporter [Longimicrobiaceae bacterium]|nr:MDR family MFS transporter [Longimicrobiaceae bacterium]
MSSHTESPERPARRTRRPLVLSALVLAMFLAAIEGTIVATAMPSIAAKLGGFSLYGWVFSSYLLMQAVTTPIFGKLADLFGRKPVFIAGVLVFMLGSVLCGFAHSMTWLIAFRFLQGAGAGAVLPISSTLAADLYSLEERGRVQGYLASVWGISSILGPLAGGLIVQNADWHWIFWLNVPFGIVSMLLIGLFLHERIEHHERSIDFAGAGLLLVGLTALMLALTQGGEWGAGAAGALAGASLVCLFLFVRHERRAPDPLMHLEMWSIRVIRLGNAAILALGVAMIGLISFLPTFVQGVLGRSALVAGFTLSGMTLGWPIASVVAGRLFVRLGVRRLVRAGALAALAGALVIALTASRGVVPTALGAFVMGLGFGLLNTTYIVAIQSSVPWRQRAVATASNMLMRNIGNAMGAALLGGILNLRLERYLERTGLSGRVSLDSVRSLIGEGGPGGGALDPATLPLLREGLSAGLHLVLWSIVLFALATLAVSWRVPDLAPADPPA